MYVKAKPQKLTPFVKMAKKSPSVSSPLKGNILSTKVLPLLFGSKHFGTNMNGLLVL